MNENSCGRLVTLDGVRGVAAISVTLYHAGHFYNFESPFDRAYLFVDFFFALSGFVLALSAEPRFKRGWTTGAFIRARLKRLWPVIAVGTLAGATSLGMRMGWHDIPLYLALALALLPLVRPFGIAEAFPLNSPQWSLLFELFGNVLHGLVLRRVSNPMLLVLTALFGAMLVWVAHLQGSNTCGPDAANWFFGLPRVGCTYTLGVWMGRQYAAGRARRFSVSWRTALLLPLLVVFVANAVQADIWLSDSLVAIVAFPLALWLAACSAPPSKQAAKPLTALGMLSFPLYAIHLPIIALFAVYDRSATSALTAMAVSMAGAWLIAVMFERRKKQRFLADAALYSSEMPSGIA